MIVYKVIVSYKPRYCNQCPITKSHFSGVYKATECGKEETNQTGDIFVYKVPDHRCLLEIAK